MNAIMLQVTLRVNKFMQVSKDLDTFLQSWQIKLELRKSRRGLPQEDYVGLFLLDV